MKIDYIPQFHGELCVCVCAFVRAHVCVSVYICVRNQTDKQSGQKSDSNLEHFKNESYSYTLCQMKDHLTPKQSPTQYSN